MTYSDIEKEYSSYMKDASFQLGYTHIPKFMNVNDYLCAAKSKMMKMAIEKVPYQVFALDRAIEVMIMLTEMFEVPNKKIRGGLLFMPSFDAQVILLSLLERLCLLALKSLLEY